MVVIVNNLSMGNRVIEEGVIIRLTQFRLLWCCGHE